MLNPSEIEDKSISNTVACPYHPKSELVEDHRAGDLICPECGLVVADRVADPGSEWRSFSAEQGEKDASRVGGPEDLTMPGEGLETFIAFSMGASESAKSLARTFKRRATNTIEGTLRRARPFLSELAEKMHLPSEIQREALQIFKEVLDKKKLVDEEENGKKGKEFVGKEIETQATISLALACKRRNAPRTFKELSAYSGVSYEKISRYYVRLNELLKSGDQDDEKPSSSKAKELTSVTNWFTSLVPRFCGLLDLERLEYCITYIAERASKMSHVAGRKPSSITAASIYLACQASNIKRTAKEIGEISGTSENTVKMIYKILLIKASELFPKNFVFVVPIECLPRS